MALLGIGEAEELLRLPASTLRHWERAIPAFKPRKDAFGRRVYSEADLRVFFRIKHLSKQRGLGLVAACEAILDELEANPDARARLAELRGELIGLWAECRTSGRELARRLEAARKLAQD